MRLAAIALFALLLPAPAVIRAAELPSDSIYRLDARLVDQDGRASGLDRERGHVTLVSMLYTSCPNVCPLLIAAAQRIDHALGDEQRAKLRVLLVSLDPERDTAAALRATADEHRIDRSRWTLARAEEVDVRRIAVTLGIQYRKLPSGELNHSSVITLLDAEGRILARTSMLARLDEDFLARVRAALAVSP